MLVTILCTHTRFWSSEKMCFSHRGEGTTHSRSISVCNSYRILQQISFRVFERRSEGVHWEICVLYAKVCVCVCMHACVCAREKRVEWCREQGVGWWAKAWCLQVQSARESGIKLSHPHINYSAARIVRALACHSGRRQTWARRENENGEQGREGRRRRGSRETDDLRDGWRDCGPAWK